MAKTSWLEVTKKQEMGCKRSQSLNYLDLVRVQEFWQVIKASQVQVWALEGSEQRLNLISFVF